MPTEDSGNTSAAERFNEDPRLKDDVISTVRGGEPGDRAMCGAWVAEKQESGDIWVSKIVETVGDGDGRE